MSYCTQDRHGACTTYYASGKSTEAVGTGKTWWPDFGPGIRDHSFQEKFAPHHHIFEKVVKPHTVGRPAAPPRPEREPTQFRHPAPAREAMLMKDVPTNEARLAAKEVTDRQNALRMMEVRQRKIESWATPPPMRMLSSSSSKGRSLLKSSSEPSLRNSPSTEAVKASRGIYEKLGYLVGRSKGATADGYSGVRPRRANSLSFNVLMFGGSVIDGARFSSSRHLLPRKPGKQWRASPENSFTFDPQTSLPVPRGGWNSQPPTSWTEPPAAGRREWVAPVTFDARPKPSALKALPAYQHSPTPAERKLPSGSAVASVRKLSYSGTADSERGPWNTSQTSGFGGVESDLGSQAEEACRQAQ